LKPEIKPKHLQKNFTMKKIKNFTLFKLAFVLLIVLFSISVKAGDTTEIKKPNEEKPKEENAKEQVLKDAKGDSPAKTIPLPEPRVMDVYNEGHADKQDSKRRAAGIGNIIVIKVSNLSTLLKKSKCRTIDDKDSTGCNPQPIRLFINGRMIKNITPISGAPQIDTITKYGELQYRLDRNESNNDAWIDLLGGPKIGEGEFFKRPVTISVGLENEYPIDVYDDPNDKIGNGNFLLVRIQETWFWWCFVGIIVYLIGIILLATKTDLLRDRGINVKAVFSEDDKKKYKYDPDKKIKRPYSLGRFQMAFWFTLVVISFLFIWLITGASDIITASILGLIGISAGTSLSSAVIDNSKNQELLRQTIDLKTEKIQLDKDVPDLESQIKATPAPANLGDLQTQLNIKKARLEVIKPEIDENMLALKPPESKGFMDDILSDVNGISFHRLQMFVWTWVLGILFIYSVWARLSMPEFSAILLALQGITAGTYLGFKIPEKQS